MSIFNLSSDEHKFVIDTTSGNKGRTLASTIALAFAISEVMRAGPLDDVELQGKVTKYVEFVNSFIPVCVLEVRDLAMRVLRWRYTVSSTGPLNGMVLEETNIKDFFGLSTHFDERILQEIAGQGHVIAVTKASFTKLLFALPA